MGDADHDQALLARARAGEAPAFAILVHRHAAVLHAAASAGEDLKDRDGALATVQRTFVRAMRRLDRADPTDVGGWLRQVQGTPLEPADIEHAPPLTTTELDELWRELSPRWPRGRRPWHVPRWIGKVAVVLVLLALAVAVPYALLVTAADDEDQGPAPIAEVVAVPIDDDGFDLTSEDAAADAADDAAEPAPDIDREDP